MDEKLDSCTCPSGDGSLRHPCPAHPATLATVKHGGCVQLGNANIASGLRNMLSDIEWLGAAPMTVDTNLIRDAIAALSAQPSPGGQGALRRAKHCQNGYSDICLASQRDGVICPEDSCDIDDGIRHNHLAARQPVVAVPQGCDACDRTGIRQNDQGRNICCPDCDLGRACAGDTHQPVGEPVQRLVEAIEGECDGLAISRTTAGAILAHVFPTGQAASAYMVDGRIEQGLFFDRNAADNMAAMNAGEVVPLFRSPAQAVDLGEIIEQIAQQWDGCNYDAVGETIDVGQAIRAAGKRLIDSQAEVRRG